MAQTLLERRWSCKPPLYCHCLQISCDICIQAGNLTHRGPVGSGVHLQSYDWRPGRARRGVHDDGHGILKVKGESGRSLTGVWLVGYPETHTPPQVWLHWRNATPGFVYAAPSTHRWGNLRSKGLVSNSFQKGFASSRTFSLQRATLSKIQAPDFPAELHRGGSPGGAATGELEVSHRACCSPSWLVTSRPWTSESESRVNLQGPRRILDGGIDNRCLLDADDGVIGCYITFIENSRLRSLRAGPPGPNEPVASGELLSADLTQKFDLSTGGNSVKKKNWDF